MPKRSNIVLVGFMGTGKTAVGRALAARLGRTFVDTDRWIAEDAGLPIPRIFAEQGEVAFREREAAAIVRAAALSHAVIATGGGALGRSENVERLRATGILVCLTARPEVILARTRPWTDRPMLAGAADPAARVAELLAARETLYAQADFAVDTSDIHVSEVAAIIAARVEAARPAEAEGAGARSGASPHDAVTE
jgi:shikimate kinase